MNTYDERHVIMSRQRIHQQFKQAEKGRLVREARRAAQERGEQLAFYAPALAQLGELMVNVGHQLQSRYSTLKEDARRITGEMTVVKQVPQPE